MLKFKEMTSGNRIPTGKEISMTELEGKTITRYLPNRRQIILK
jgi:hypothetical protein